MRSDALPDPILGAGFLEALRLAVDLLSLLERLLVTRELRGILARR